VTSWLLAAVGVSFATIALAFVPLFDILAFEFAVTMGAVLAYVSGWRACSRAAATRAAAPRPLQHAGFPGTVLLRLGVQNLLVALLPLGLISANSMRVPTCNWGEGLRFYAIFALPGILYGTSLGFGFGLAWPAARARTAFVLWSLATYAYALWHVLREPPIFAFNAFVGFFPGPLYDREVALDGRLVLARLIVVLQSLFFALASALLWDGYRLRLRAAAFPWQGTRAVAGPLVLALALALGLLQAGAARLGLRPDRNSIRRQLGGHIATAHCDVYYDTASYTAARAAELAREHEFHYAGLRDFFGFDVPRRIGSYVYASAAKKKRLMGAGGTSFEDALNDEIHLNAGGWPHPVLRHEMAHIFAAHLVRWWRVCPLIGVHEGIAVAAEWRQESARLGLTPDEACAAMDSLGLLPDLRRSLGAFGFWTQPGARAYTAAGSFVSHLLQAHGSPKFRVLWASRSFEKAYGQGLEALLLSWKRERLAPLRLTAAQLQRAERLYRPPSVFAVPCAREQARLHSQLAELQRLQQYDAAEAVYDELQRLDPADHGREIERAGMHMRSGDFEVARRRLRAVLATPELPPVWRSRALDNLGDALWRLGRHEEADSAYAQARLLASTRDETRALDVALAALREPSLRGALATYLTVNPPGEAGLALLASVRAALPEHVLPRYLLGRRLYYAEQFDAAGAELAPVLAAPGQPPTVRLATAELLALSALRAGRPEDVDAALQAALALELEPAERLALDDIRSRAKWELAAAASPAALSGSMPP
jgi:tetratricopeptide (TPR) repeat protein